MLSLRFFKISFATPFVAHLEINRPEKLNAFFDPMWDELKVAFEWLSENPEVRCVLFSGSGEKAFTTGLDVMAAASADSPLRRPHADPARRAFALHSHILHLQSAVSSISACRKPVICLLHGFSYGAAVDLAVAADIRICTRNARLCVKEIDIGLAADLGTLSRLPKVLGGVTSWCKEVCLTAREFSGEEAGKVGLVSEVVDGGREELVKRGVSLANVIAAKSPVAVQGTKHILDEGWRKSVDDNLNYTATWNAGMLQTGDIERAMGMGPAKRSPTFEKL